MLAAIKRRLHRPRVREIPLERLSRLWLTEEDYSASGFTRRSCGGVAGTGRHTIGEKVYDEVASMKKACPPANGWINEDINGFYRQYVGPCLASLGPAQPVIERILTILDEHGGCPSSNAKTDSEEEHVFAEISLREYSLEVARIAFDMIKKGHRDYEMIAGKLFVITLGHQLGIMSDADILGGISAKSVLLLDPLIQDLPYKESVVNAIRTFEANHPKTDEARILKAASSAARKNEYERAKVFSKAWQQPVMDIKKIKRAIESQPAGSSHADRPDREKP